MTDTPDDVPLFPDFHSFRNFEEAARETLKFLQSKYGFDLWMVTRTVRDDWIVLQAEDAGYDVAAGDIFRWSDSFCYRMVRDQGPHIAPRSETVEAYADAPVGKELPIKAYIGYPLTNADGSLFGTLCAIDHEPQPLDLEDDEALFRILAQYLSLAIVNEMRSNALREQIESLSDQAHKDPLTNLLNRRSWDSIMERQEEKCRVMGEPATVIIIDLDGLKFINDTLGHDAGDEFISRAATAIAEAARRNDMVARLGGDEFGVLVEGAFAMDPLPLVERIRENLAFADVAASVGWALRKPGDTLAEAMKTADYLMYRDKEKRKADQSASHLG